MSSIVILASATTWPDVAVVALLSLMSLVTLWVMHK